MFCDFPFVAACGTLWMNRTLTWYVTSWHQLVSAKVDICILVPCFTLLRNISSKILWLQQLLFWFNIGLIKYHHISVWIMHLCTSSLCTNTTVLSWCQGAITCWHRADGCDGIVGRSGRQFPSRFGSRFAPSLWETVWLCDNVRHWLGANLGSVLFSARVRPFRPTMGIWSPPSPLCVQTTQPSLIRQQLKTNKNFWSCTAWWFSNRLQGLATKITRLRTLLVQVSVFVFRTVIHKLKNMIWRLIYFNLFTISHILITFSQVMTHADDTITVNLTTSQNVYHDTVFMLPLIPGNLLLNPRCMADKRLLNSSCRASNFCILPAFAVYTVRNTDAHGKFRQISHRFGPSNGCVDS